MTNSLNTARITPPLEDELERIQASIRHDPAAVNLRVHLFQLLCILGRWQRAVAQLQVCAQLDAGTIPMAKTYREALRCELIRAEVFAGKRSPQVMDDAPAWLALMIEAQQRLASGAVAAAHVLREAALESAPATAGKVDGQTFRWLGDADSRLGPVVEAIVNGQYYWIPFSQLRSIELDAPADLRDFVWLPAQLTFTDGSHAVALIPTRYAGSELADDDAKLARTTSWNQVDDVTYAGIGQRMLATDEAEYALLDVRRIDFEHACA